MKRIVVGFGVHRSSEHTLRWAALLARRASAELVALNVFHPAYVEMAPSTHQELLAARRALIEDIVGRTGLDGVEIAVVQGEAVDELIRYGDKVDADLLVVGHHDSMAPGGFGQHGPAEGLLRSSSIPFVVVDERSPLPDVDGDLVLVVGVDGSEANAESVDTIARIATDLRAKAVPVLSVNTGESTTRDHYGSHLLHEDDAAAIAALLPGDAQLRTINESPVQGLIDEADEVDALLIAIGTRGHWKLGDLFAGQITRHVIEHAHRAVLVAPHVS